MFDEEIREELTQQSAVLVVNAQRVLLNHVDSMLPQPMCQCIFVDLLQMPMPMVTMDGETRFPD